jgi:Uncharacterized conserved protein
VPPQQREHNHLDARSLREDNGLGYGGSYVLLLRNYQLHRIRIGRLGLLTFREGFYAYFGSMFGRGGLRARIRRHLRKKRGREHWHIDYVLRYMEVEAVYILPRKDLESRLSRRAVERYSYVEGFGCSDRRGDRSHLIHLKNNAEVREFARLIVSAGFKKCRPVMFSKGRRC